MRAVVGCMGRREQSTRQGVVRTCSWLDSMLSMLSCIKPIVASTWSTHRAGGARTLDGAGCGWGQARRAHLALHACDGVVSAAVLVVCTRTLERGGDALAEIDAAHAAWRAAPTRHKGVGAEHIVGHAAHACEEATASR